MLSEFVFTTEAIDHRLLRHHRRQHRWQRQYMPVRREPTQDTAVVYKSEDLEGAVIKMDIMKSSCSRRIASAVTTPARDAHARSPGAK